MQCSCVESWLEFSGPELDCPQLQGHRKEAMAGLIAYARDGNKNPMLQLLDGHELATCKT